MYFLRFLILFLVITNAPLAAMEITPTKENNDLASSANSVNNDESSSKELINALIAADLQEHNNHIPKPDISGVAGKKEHSSNELFATATVPFAITQLPNDLQKEIAAHIAKDLPIIKVLRKEIEELKIKHIEHRNITQNEAEVFISRTNRAQQNSFTYDEDKKNEITIHVTPDTVITYKKKGKVIDLWQEESATVTAHKIATFKTASPVLTVAINKNSLFTAHTVPTNDIQVWDLTARGTITQPVYSLDLPSNRTQGTLETITALATTDNLLIAATAEGDINIFDLVSLNAATQPKYTLKTTGILTMLAVHKNLLFTIHHNLIRMWDLTTINNTSEPILCSDDDYGIKATMCTNETLSYIKKAAADGWILNTFEIGTNIKLAQVLKNFDLLMQKNITYLHAMLLIKLNKAHEQKSQVTLSPLYKDILKQLITLLTQNCGKEIAEKVHNTLSQYITKQADTLRITPFAAEHLPHLNSWIHKIPFITWPHIDIPSTNSYYLFREIFIKKLIKNNQLNAAIIYLNNIPYGYAQYFACTHHYDIDYLHTFIELVKNITKETSICLDLFISSSNEKDSEYYTVILTQLIKDIVHQNPPVTTIIVGIDKSDTVKINLCKKIGFTLAELELDQLELQEPVIVMRYDIKKNH